MKGFGKIFSFFIAVLFMATFLIECADKPKDVVSEKPARPEWVDKGSGAFDGDRAFYAVGSAFGIQNPSLLRSTADNRARAELAKIFKTYTASLMKDYQASTMAGDPNETSEEQHVENTFKTFTKAELSGAMIVDHWKDPETGEYFSLVRMDLDVFEDYLNKAKELSEAVRARVIEHAEKAFADLEAEEAKHE